jgi:hypothetical protein
MHEGPAQIPAGRRAQARRRAYPERPRVLDQGEHYRFLGKTYVDLSAEAHAQGSSEGGGSGSFSPQRSPQAFTWSTQEGCEADPSVRWSIVYGLLRDSRDTALARVGGRRYDVKVSSIPASFRAGGELAYVVLPRQPSEVIVDDASGHAVQDEHLDGLSSRCERGESSGIATVGP